MIYKKREGHVRLNQDPPQPGSTILIFQKEYLQQILRKRDLNDVHSYKNIFWAERFSISPTIVKQKLNDIYSEINTTEMF